MLIPVRVCKRSTKDSDGLESIIYGFILTTIIGCIGSIPISFYMLLSDSLNIFYPFITAIDFLTVIPVLSYVIYSVFIINFAYIFSITYNVVFVYAIIILVYAKSQLQSMNGLQKLW